MISRQKILNLLGLSMRANKLITGESFTLDAIKNQKAKIVFVASDASENTLKTFKNKTTFYEVPLNIEFTKEELSRAIGKNRTSVALLDKGFAESIKKLIED